MADPTQAEAPPAPSTAAQDLADQWNADRASEAAEAKQSALDVLLSMPRAGDTGKSAAKEGLDYLLDRWDDLLRVGEHLVQTRMVRKGLNTGAEAALIMALGRALRVDPVVALNNIYVVNNKPTCESKLLAGLIFREHGPQAINYVNLSEIHAVIDFKRNGQAQATRFTFTMADAKRAGLLNKPGGVWKQYPQFMLRHRCMSLGGNAIFPDVTCGMITPEEMGLPVKVDDGGNVTVDQSQLDKPKPQPQQPAAPAQPDESTSIRGPFGGFIREIRDERAEGNTTRRECLLRDWPDNWVLIVKSNFDKYKPGKNEWKNAGLKRPFTCNVVDGKNMRRQTGDEVWFLSETLRHPAATGAIEVPDFKWQEEEANAPTGDAGAPGGAQGDATPDVQAAAEPPASGSESETSTGSAPAPPPEPSADPRVTKPGEKTPRGPFDEEIVGAMADLRTLIGMNRCTEMIRRMEGSVFVTDSWEHVRDAEKREKFLGKLLDCVNAAKEK